MLEIVLTFILAIIALIVIGIYLENKRNAKLKKEFLDYNCKILILTESAASIDFRVGKKHTIVIEITAEELANPNSFCHRIMKKTGVEKLPMEVWVSTFGKLEGKYMKRPDEK